VGRLSEWICTSSASVLVRMTDDGRKLGTARISNSPAALRAELAISLRNSR